MSSFLILPLLSYLLWLEPPDQFWLQKESRYLYLIISFLDPRGKEFRQSTCDVICRFLYMLSISFSSYSTISSLLFVFIMNMCGFCQMPNWDDHVVLTLFINRLYYLIYFLMLILFCIPWIISLVVVIAGIWLAGSLVKIFVSIFIRNIGLVMSLPGFGIRRRLVSQNELRSIPSSCIFWKSLWRIGINSFYKCMAEGGLGGSVS